MQHSPMNNLAGAKKHRRLKMFRFLNYYRLVGFMLFLVGLELTFRNNGFILIRYLGIFLLCVGAYDVITGKSMKMSTIVNSPMPQKNTPTNSQEEIPKKEESFKFDRKNIIKNLLKKNAILSILMLGAAVFLFNSSSTLTKKFFSYQDVNTKVNFPNYAESTDIKTTVAEPVKETINLSTSYLKNQVVIKINSIEKTPKNTYLNVTIENNSKKGIQLSDLEKFQIVDDNKNIYKLTVSNLSYNILNPIDASSSADLKLPFQCSDSSSKIMKFKGQFWILTNGVQEVPFEMDIKK